MFGERLKRLRKEHDLKQEDLGKLLNVTPNSISNWENGVSEPNYETVIKIAEYFNTSTDYLLGFNKDDLGKIEQLKIALKEAGFIVNNDLSIESLNKALQIVQVLDDNKDTN